MARGSLAPQSRASLASLGRSLPGLAHRNAGRGDHNRGPGQSRPSRIPSSSRPPLRESGGGDRIYSETHGRTKIALGTQCYNNPDGRCLLQFCRAQDNSKPRVTASSANATDWKDMEQARKLPNRKKRWPRRLKIYEEP